MSNSTNTKIKQIDLFDKLYDLDVPKDLNENNPEAVGYIKGRTHWGTNTVINSGWSVNSGSLVVLDNASENRKDPVFIRLFDKQESKEYCFSLAKNTSRTFDVDPINYQQFKISLSFSPDLGYGPEEEVFGTYSLTLEVAPESLNAWPELVDRQFDVEVITDAERISPLFLPYTNLTQKDNGQIVIADTLSVGYDTTITGKYSVASGYQTKAIGDNSHASGHSSIAGGKCYYFSDIDFENKKIYLSNTQVFGPKTEVSGVWKFKYDHINDIDPKYSGSYTDPETGEMVDYQNPVAQNINFSCNGVSYNKISASYFNPAGITGLSYYQGENEITVYGPIPSIDGHWHDEVYKTIDFGKEAQPVSAEFYSWLTDVARLEASDITIPEELATAIVGQYLYIHNTNAYYGMAKVAEVGNGYITYTGNPGFNSINSVAEANIHVDDWTVRVPSVPEFGVVAFEDERFGGVQTAEGYWSYATGIGSHAEGSSIAAGSWSHAEGNETEAAYGAHSEGSSTKALGVGTHAEGSGSIAGPDPVDVESGVAGQNMSNETAYYTGAHAEGYWTKSKAKGSHAEGMSTTASGHGSHAEGQNTKASGIGSHTEGYKTEATGSYTHAEGVETDATAEASHAEGKNTISSGTATHAEGGWTKATQPYAHSEGQETQANGKSSHAEGYKTITKANYSHAEGDNTTASAQSAHAEGTTTVASGIAAHAEGNKTQATGAYTHTEGSETKATMNNAHAEGNRTQAIYYNAHAEGQDTIAKENSAHAEGDTTQALKRAAHSEGRETIAYSGASHAEGYRTKAGTEGKADYEGAHAEGYETTAYGKGAHAEGEDTTSSGIASHAEGKNTLAHGDYSHASGINTKAYGSESVVFGRNNSAGARGYYLNNAYWNDSTLSLALGTTYKSYCPITDVSGILPADWSSTGYEVNIHITDHYPNFDFYVTDSDGYLRISRGSEQVEEFISILLELNGGPAENAGNARSWSVVNTSMLDSGEVYFGNNSFVSGEENKGWGNHIHIEGARNIAGGEAAHAEGADNSAEGNNSHAEGQGNHSFGNDSHAEGRDTKSIGEASHAAGIGTIAKEDGQTVVGKYNSDDEKALFVVGAGISDSVRSNAFTAGKNSSNEYYITVGSTTLTENQLKKILAFIEQSDSLLDSATWGEF